MTMSFTVAKALEGINYTIMDPHSQPNACSCNQMRKDLDAYLLSIPTTLGGGHHGHLALHMTPVQYAALPGNPQAFVVPQDPAPLQLPANTGSATIATCKTQWKQQKEEYTKYQEVQCTGNLLLQTIVPPHCLKAIAHDITGLDTIFQLYDHVITNYGTMTKDDLNSNKEDMAKPWDTSHPVEEFFACTDKCIAFSNLPGGDPITDAKALHVKMNVIEKSGVLQDAMNNFEKHPAAEQTRANFHTNMTTANACRIQCQMATGELGYDANAVQKENKEDKENSPPESDNRGKSTQKGPPFLYCWTCGLVWGCNAHTSRTCPNPALGHKKSTTFGNMKGGNPLMPRCRGEEPHPHFNHLVYEE